MDYDSRVEVTLKQDSGKNDEDNSGSEVSLRELIEVLIRRKFLIIAIALIAIGLTFLYSVISNPYRQYDGVTRVILQYNFDGIEKGLDPKGQRFDPLKIKSPAVLDRVVDTLGLEEEGITSSDLRDYVDVSPVVPGSVIELTQKRIESLTLDDTAVFTGDDFMYFPNKYVVSFYIPKNSSITGMQAERILRETVEAYIKYFYDTFTDRVTLDTAFELINYEEYDYPEIANIMRKQIGIIQNYLSAKMIKHPNFRSQSTGLSFGDIYEGTSVLMDLDVNKLISYIRAYKLSKNPETLITTWQSLIRNYEMEMAMLENESRQTREALNNYEKDKIIIMGGTDIAYDSLEVESKSPLYDELVLRYLDAGVKSKNFQYEIEYIMEDIDLFLGIQDDEESDEAYRISPAEIKEAEEKTIEMIAETSAKLQEWMVLTNETVDDYIANVYYDRAIMQLTPVQSSRLPISRLRLNLAVGLVLGLMIGIFWAFMKEYWVKSDTKTSRA